MDIKIGTITAVEIDWWKSYAWLPHKTISGRWVWLELVHKRRVWVSTGFVDEPETQYGTLFDMLEDR